MLFLFFSERANPASLHVNAQTNEFSNLLSPKFYNFKILKIDRSNPKHLPLPRFSYVEQTILEHRH